MPEVKPFRCLARQYSDQMQCECGLTWDMNDPDPPECPQETRVRQDPQYDKPENE